MIRALVIHPGTQHAFRLATELHRLDALAGLHTGFAAGAGSGWERPIGLLPAGLSALLSNRMVGGLPVRLVHLQMGLELASQVRLRLAGGEGQGVLHWRNERFQRAVPERALREADVVIGFDTSSWILTQRCRALGKPLIMVQTIGHPHAMAKVAEQVTAQFPDWDTTWERRLPRVREAEQIEHDATTLIVGSSRFTRQTLIDHGVAADKIHVLPHGVDAARFSVAGERGSRPFRFVFVGSVSARKGVPLLLEAWRRLQPSGAELWVVGPIALAVRKLVPALPGLRLWGEVPGVEVPGILQQCDVMVFPTYFEGFGLVILQAMACGLPVITTAATAGPDLLPTPGAGGWIVPTGDLQRLTEAMEHCLANQEEMREVGLRGRATAERFNWQVYGRNWLPVLAEASSRVSAASAGAPSGNFCTPSVRSRPPDILLAHPGTQYSFRLAAELHQQGRLADFHTGLALAGDSLAMRIWDRLPRALQRRVANRRLTALPSAKLHSYPVEELMTSVRGWWDGDGERVLHVRNARFQQSIPDSAIRHANTVVGFDTSSWLLARRAKALGKHFILDQSIGHPAVKERVFAGLRERYPTWNFSVPCKADTHMREEREEHALADFIVVPSRFVKQTLMEEGVAEEKIRIIPFGTDLQIFRPENRPQPFGPVVFLFVGSVSARKGVPVLLEAWRRSAATATAAELWLVGSGRMPAHEQASLPPSVKVLGMKSQADVAALMRRADVFIFPSFFEGLAQVQVEALASGLPVVATAEAGASELIRPGENGFLIPVGDALATAACIERLVMDVALRAKLRQNAVSQREELSWRIYGDRWARLLEELS